MPFVKTVATFTDTASTTSKVVTIPAGAGTTAGNVLILPVVTSGNITFSATDTKGNTYAVLRANNSGSTVSVALLGSKTIAALVPGDKITVTGSGAQWGTFGVHEFSGLGALNDAAVGQGVTTTSPTYDTTSGTVPTGSHLLFSIVGTNGGGRTATPSGSGTWIPLTNPDQTASFPRSSLAFYQEVTGGGTLRNNGVLSSNVVYGAIAVALPSGTTARQGTASGTWGFTGTAVGGTAKSGSASGSWGFTHAAVGGVPSVGSASGTWSFSGAASGLSTRQGSAAGSWGFKTLVEAAPPAAVVLDGTAWKAAYFQVLQPDGSWLQVDPDAVG